MLITNNIITVNKYEVNSIAISYLIENGEYHANTWQPTKAKDKASILTNTLGLKLLAVTGDNYSYEVST